MNGPNLVPLLVSPRNGGCRFSATIDPSTRNRHPRPHDHNQSWSKFGSQHLKMTWADWTRIATGPHPAQNNGSVARHLGELPETQQAFYWQAIFPSSQVLSTETVSDPSRPLTKRTSQPCYLCPLPQHVWAFLHAKHVLFRQNPCVWIGTP